MEGAGVRSRVSAGLVLFRVREGQLEVCLAHPGGPFFARKDEGHWTIPKGEVEEGEDLIGTAIREVREEIGVEIDKTQRFIELGSIRQKGGKRVHAWAVEYCGPEPAVCESNVFQMEWPPGSGALKAFPEVDRVQFYPLKVAKLKVKQSQIPLLEALAEKHAETAHFGGTKL
jgi:predicted NUDIX family NTP pyrophosphohydrolase